MARPTRKNLIQTLCWFTLFNLALIYLVALRYLWYLPVTAEGIIFAKGKIILSIFNLVTLLGHFALLILAPMLLVLIPILIFPNKKLFLVLSVSLFFLFIMLVFIDSTVYAQYRFHLNGVIWQMLFGGAFKQIFDFNIFEYSAMAAIALLILIGELVFFRIANYLVTQKFFTSKMPLFTFGILLFCYYVSLLMLAFSGPYGINRFMLTSTRIYPFYDQIIGAILPTTYGKIALNRVGEVYIAQPEQVKKTLNYPHEPLICKPPKKPLNIVIIVIDTWRFDSFTPKVTPNIFQFSTNAQVFNRHLSGGNATRGGIFSLFYGLPSTYWSSFKSEQIRPVFIDFLLQHGYQLGIFSSSKLIVPAFHKTVFAHLIDENYQTPGEFPYQRDQAMTQTFTQFMQSIDPNKPFFSFLFYDAAHKFCASSGPYTPFQPAVPNCLRLELTSSTKPLPYFNRYRNALFGIDKQIQIVLNTLKQHHQLENTIVVITSDHGQEFNDNKLGYWGHAGNYTDYQVHVPFILYWPGMKPASHSHLTSHYDLVPTLMQKVFHCKNPVQDYSIGLGLFNLAQRPYIIVTSYIDFALVTEDAIIRVYPAGDVQIENKSGRIINKPIDVKLLQKVFKDLNYFYKK